MSDKTPFDHIAQTYDADFSHTIIGRLQRNRIWKMVEKDIPKQPLRVLEINCGTGIDAVWLAKKGHEVIATDASWEMIHACKPTHNVRFVKASFEELTFIFNDQQFDLIFSNFAGLNCVDESILRKLNDHFAHLLKSNGLFIAVFLGKYCWQERLFFRLKGDNKRSTRRQEKAEARLAEGVYQTTYCYDSRHLSSIFTDFSLLRKRPVGIIIPPSYLEPFMKKVSFILPLLQLIERIFSSFSFLADKGDHLYMAWRKSA